MAVNGLTKITGKILAEAQAEADRILADAEAECEAIRKDYQARADAIRERLNEEAETKGADMVARARSAAAMKKRNLIQETKGNLMDSVFTDAKAWVLQLDTARYAELLVGLLSSALIEVVETEEKNRAVYGDEDEVTPERYEVVLSKRDRENCGSLVVEGIRKKLAGKLDSECLNKLVLSDATANIEGGAILRYGDVESNCSFEMLFAGLHRELEAEVHHALFFARTKN